jgi:hypothetical protein
MAKSYKVKNLEAKLKESNAIADAMKRSIDSHNGPDWAKNNLIKRYNKQVRVSNSIKDALLRSIVNN